MSTSSPTGRPLPTEAEVRSVVETVLAGLTAAAQPARATSRATSGEAPHPAPKPGVAVGADHGGYRLKERIAAALREDGVEVRDCGTHGTEAVDYPEFAHAVSRLVADGECQAGIVVDGAGIGSCIAANKVPGIRAATCWDVSSARNSREHNHANVLALGAGLLGDNLALEIVRTWLETPWGGDRHARRVAKIGELERRYLAVTELEATR